MLHLGKKWVVAPYDSQLQLKISEELNISPFLAQLCINRGMTTHKEVENFVRISPAAVNDPFLFRHMDQAVSLIKKTINNREKILIYGDYDVDGITATSLLYLYLKQITSLVSYYIPDRLEEGYGLNEEAVLWASREGYKLIITVDCGISSTYEAEVAKSHGVNIIITDHHTPPEKLPEVSAIINPKVKESGYPFLDLAGVGVAWKLAQALEISRGLRGKDNDVVLGDYLDLVALGTVADVVPLKGENRIIVSLGLKNMAEFQRPGIKALLSLTCLDDKNLSSGQIGYILAPRINAVGRLSQGSLAVQLLTGEDYNLCFSQAEKMEKMNSERQEVEGEILKEALKMIEEQADLVEDFVIVLASENWHPGVIGIVSSRLMERFYRPVVLLSIEGEIAKGSARSIEHFDIYQAFHHCREFLVQFGGHKMAAGVKLKKENIPSFQRAINNYASAVLNKDLTIPSLKIDLELDTGGEEGVYIEDCEKLSPFGSGNSQPIFAYRNLRVLEAKSVGNNQSHLKLTLDTGDYLLDGVGFNMSHHLSWINPFTKVDAAVTIEKNKWNGYEKVQLVLKDIKPHNSLSLAADGLKATIPHIIRKNPVSEFLADFRQAENREKYLINLLNMQENCLIYVSTNKQGEELIQFIKENGPSLTKAVWCHGGQSSWQHGLIMAKVRNKLINTVVFTGDLYVEKAGLFKHIVFYHSPKNMEELFRFICLGSGSSCFPKIHLLFNTGDLEEIDCYLKTMFPDRELLGQIYKAVKKLASSANQIFGSREEILRSISIKGLDKGKEKAFEAWISVMIELGLIKMTLTGHRYRLELINNGNKCNLEDSFCYIEGLKEKKAFECWARIALSPRLNDEIYSLLG